MKNLLNRYEIVKQAHLEYQEKTLTLECERNTLEKQLEKEFVAQKLYLPISELSKFDGQYIAEMKCVLRNGEIYDLQTNYGVKVDDIFLEPLDRNEKDIFFTYDMDILYLGDRKDKEKEVIGFYEVWLLNLESYEIENGFPFEEGSSEPVDKDYEILVEETTMENLIRGAKC